MTEQKSSLWDLILVTHTHTFRHRNNAKICQASYKKYRGDVLLPVGFVQLTESGDSAGSFIRICAEIRKCRVSRLFAIDIALTELLEYFSLPKLGDYEK